MPPCAITAYTATSCLGSGREAMWRALVGGRSGLTPCRFLDAVLDTWIGEVPGIDAEPLPAVWDAFDCRNNRLAWHALQQDGFATAAGSAVGRYGAERVGVFLGTSTSGLLSTELAYQNRDAGTGALPADFRYAGAHNTYSVAAFTGTALGATGPTSVQSAACASSAKVFASAARALAAGVIDAAVVGGVDSLCLTTLYGFSALELVSPQRCRPFDAARDGISIAEAAAFALLERPAQGASAPLLVGYGESSDAFHMSSPHPEGAGAAAAMRAALARAGLEPGAIDYINLHGTATPSNDAAEDAAVTAVFEGMVPVSSTKGAHGHALGAAGALEAVVCLLALEHALMPGGLHVARIDPALSSPYLTANRPAALARVMSNSFGFGGANCALVFSGGRR